MLKWEMAPHSKCGKYRLLVSYKRNDEIYLTVLQELKPAINLKISEIQNEKIELIKYIKDLYPKILSGVYEYDLLDEQVEQE